VLILNSSRKKKLFFYFLIILFLLIVSIVTSVTSKENGSMISYKAAIAGDSGVATVPITTTELTEVGNNYNIKPGRLKFEFDGKLYAIQLRRVKQGHVEFLIMTLDMNDLDDITAYSIDDSFSLRPNERKEIDIDKDGIEDISIELNDIIFTGKYNSVKSADFFIKEIRKKI